MKLKSQLVRDGETVFERPLSPTDWPREQLENEFNALEEDFHRISKVFNALSNKTRLMMMRRLMEERDRTMNFADFIRDLDMNPKLVWENTRKPREGGLVEKIGRGRYRCSEFGDTDFIMMSLTLRGFIEDLEEIESL